MTGDLRLWSLNLLLVAVLAFCSYGAWTTWAAPMPAIRPEKTSVPSDREARVPRLKGKRLDRLNQYDVVAVKNLFARSRSEFVKVPDPTNAEVSEAATKVTISGKQVHLYGVILTEKKRVAFINDPEQKTSGRKTRTIRENDTIGGLTVSRIMGDRIVLEGGGKVFEISLYDKNKPVPPIRRPPVPHKAPKNKDKPQVVTAGKTARRAKPSPSPAPQPASRTNAGKDEPEFEIINTPFGKIKRRVK
ncbi:MAG: hypothetical protein CSA22_04045 [Deltaproteobacteria bacterium]|nr:MAG: hypothetical protein CSA22_04045 [Deltaproteobacteria bacterium]